MNSLMGLLTIIVFIISIHLGIETYLKVKKNKQYESDRILNVLKIITKHECFKNFPEEQAEFAKWISEFLALKGYRNVFIVPKENDAGKDLVAENNKGEKVYILCKLSDPEYWDKDITRSEAQKFIGGMVGDGIKNGLVITTASICPEAKEYLIKLNGLGYKLQIIEGDALVKELYQLRRKHIVPLLNTLKG